MFQIIATGIGYEHGANFAMERKDGYPHYLALLIRTKSRLRVDGEEASYPPNTFLLYDVHSPQYYAADGELYADDWIQFTCKAELLRRFGLPLDRPFPMPDYLHPEQYFSMICNAFFRNYNDDTVIDSLMTAMLTDFSEVLGNRQTEIPYYGQMVELRKKIFASPQTDWNVPAMAEELHISTSYFQRLYRSAFGMPVMRDVILNRIESAKNLLRSSGLTADEIARLCGYTSAEHFSRQFKQYVGMPPDKWRRMK